MDNLICIYIIRNNVNNKKYIGQTINFEERKRHHMEAIYNKNRHEYNRPLYRAFRKYGIENFTFKIIDYASSIEEANHLETVYISFFKSLIDDGYGYNLEKGGKNGLKSEFTKQKISEAHKGYGGGSFGKRKGEAYRARKILCINNNTIYPSIIECAEDIFGENYTKTDRLKISACANPVSNRFTHKGYSFRYIAKNGKIIPKMTQPLSRGRYNTKGMKVVELKSKLLFSKIKYVSEYFNISSSMVRDRVYGRIQNTENDNFIFKNLDDLVANGEAVDQYKLVW